MPKTIPCYDCKGPGCKTCKDGGVLSVYTQAELDEAVKAESEAIIELGERLWNDHVNQGSANGSLTAKGIGRYIKAIRARNK